MVGVPNVQRFAVAVAGVLLDSAGRVLLIREAHGARQYGLPGGILQGYDSPEEALVREFEAQTAVEVGVEHVVGVRYRSGQPQSLIVISYRCRLISGAARLTRYGDIDEVGWFETRSLPGPISSSVEPAIEAASLQGRGMIFPELAGELQRRRQLQGRRDT